MIIYKNGDIFQEHTEAIVNPVNCVGVMGKGLALEFKRRYPDNFRQYKSCCEQNEVVQGKMYVSHPEHGQLIINFPTKRHWRDKSRIADIESGLVDLAETVIRLNIKSIAIPSLGCGLGGLEWGVVRDRINTALSHLDTEIVVFEPIV